MPEQDEKGTVMVLVVDHELDDLELMCRVLRKQGCRVLPASGYLAGINTFRLNAGQITLLITAVALADKNGCELAQRLLAMKPDLKVLFVSAAAGAEVCRFYGFLGVALHFLEKPLHEHEFKSMVRLILESSAAGSAAAG